MEEKYVVELSREERDYLLTLCATVPDDDAVAQEMLGECGMDRLEGALRNAETAQGDALQRLEDWLFDAPIETAQAMLRMNGLTRYEVVLENGSVVANRTRGTIADAINEALDEAEGAEDA